MIVGEALKEVFKGLEIEGQTVQFGYGDQKELNKWVSFHNSKNIKKYPLIWYVKTGYNEFNGDYKVNARLLVLMNTKVEWLNTTRTVKTYNVYINPLTDMITDRLRQNQYIQIDGQSFDKFKFIDYPSYGVNQDSMNSIRLTQNDFQSTKKNSTESITTDIVDAKVIDFGMTIKVKCII